MNDPAEFWSQVAIAGPDDCWPWLGALSSSGYGNVKWDSGDGRGERNQGAHRVALSLHLGRPLPPVKVVQHACDNRPCCNPAHLSPGTHKSNAIERADRHRGRGQRRGCDGSYVPVGRRYW